MTTEQVREVGGWLVVTSRDERPKLRELKIEPDEFHGDWNYVIKPRSELRWARGRNRWRYRKL
jgi:hypothetical protein